MQIFCGCRTKLLHFHFIKYVSIMLSSLALMIKKCNYETPSWHSFQYSFFHDVFTYKLTASILRGACCFTHQSPPNPSVPPSKPSWGYLSHFELILAGSINLPLRRPFCLLRSELSHKEIPLTTPGKLTTCMPISRNNFTVSLYTFWETASECSNFFLIFFSCWKVALNFKCLSVLH